jgi:hypothetical protein
MIRDELIEYGKTNSPKPNPVPTPDLPNWDGRIFVRKVASGVMANFYRKFQEQEDVDIAAAGTAWFACDEVGNRIFNDDDVLWLSTSPIMGPTNERLWAAAAYINGQTAENREGWRKNLPSTAESGSPCCSAELSTPVSGSTGDGS